MPAIHEGARSVIDRFPGNRHVVGVHHAVNESELHPVGDQFGLTPHNTFQQRMIRPVGPSCFRIKTADRVVRQDLQVLMVPARRKPFERAHTNVRPGHTHQDASWNRSLPHHGFARGQGGQRPRRRHPQCRHRFRHEVFAQNRSQSRTAVALSGKGCRSGPFELNVAAHAGRISDFSQKNGAAVSQLRHKAAELMARVHHRQRFCTVRPTIPRQNGHAVVGCQPFRIRAKLFGQIVIELQQARSTNRCRIDAAEEGFRQPGPGVVERKGHGADAEATENDETGRCPPNYPECGLLRDRFLRNIPQKV